MKKHLFIPLVAMAIIVLALPSVTVKAWNNADHPKMVDQAVIIFRNDFKDLLKAYPDFQKYLDTYLPKIKQGASDADAFSTTVSNKVIKVKFMGRTYEVYMPTSEHYYDPASGKGALGYFKSARQKADEYYATAKQKFSQKKYDEAFLFLGRAIHLVQDTANPHHTQIGAGAFMNWDGFANHVSSNFAKYSVTSGGLYAEANIGVMVHNNASLSSDYFKYVDGLNRLIKWINWPVDDNYPKAAQATVARAEKTTAGAMAMFLKEVLPQPKAVQDALKKINVNVKN